MMNLNQSLMVIKGMAALLDHFADSTSAMHKHEEIMKHCDEAVRQLTAATAHVCGLTVKREL
jgi:hypothetical protein